MLIIFESIDETLVRGIELGLCPNSKRQSL